MGPNLIIYRLINGSLSFPDNPLLMLIIFTCDKKDRGCGLGLHAIRDGSSGLHIVNIQMEGEEVA
jgi:hypothetical protein